MWNQTKNQWNSSNSQLQFTHWFSVEMVQYWPTLCKRKCMFLKLEIYKEVSRVYHRKADVKRAFWKCDGFFAIGKQSQISNELLYITPYLLKAGSLVARLPPIFLDFPQNSWLITQSLALLWLFAVLQTFIHNMKTYSIVWSKNRFLFPIVPPL